MTDKQINLKLPDALWLAAKIKAAQSRVSLSEAIRVLLREWVKPLSHDKYSSLVEGGLAERPDPAK